MCVYAAVLRSEWVKRPTCKRCFHNNMCSLISSDISSLNRPSLLFTLHKTATVTDAQLLRKADVRLPGSMPSRGFLSPFWSRLSVIFLMRAARGGGGGVGSSAGPCSRHVLRALLVSLGHRLTCLNYHFKYYPECFHTLVWLRWDLNYQSLELEKHSRNCSHHFCFSGPCHYMFYEEQTLFSKHIDIYFTEGDFSRLCTLLCRG